MRLTDQFMEMYRSGEFGMEKVNAQSPVKIFEILPIHIHRSRVLTTLFKDIETATETPSMSGETFMERYVDYMCDAVEDYGQEQWRW
jgi:hypothetical protein